MPTKNFNGEKLNDSIGMKIINRLHKVWKTRCDLDGARQRLDKNEAQARYFQGSHRYGVARTGSASQDQTTTNSAQTRRQRAGKRGTKVEDRELMFMGVENYIMRHACCSKCNGDLPKLKRCMCVNDSKSKNVVMNGLGVWGVTSVSFA